MKSEVEPVVSKAPEVVSKPTVEEDIPMTSAGTSKQEGGSGKKATGKRKLIRGAATSDVDDEPMK